MCPEWVREDRASSSALDGRTVRQGCFTSSFRLASPVRKRLTLSCNQGFGPQALVSSRLLPCPAPDGLKQNGLLSESVGVGYIERNWPPAFKDTGAWPLRGLRQNFLDGSLPRLLDPDSVLKQKIVEFVENGEFGLASGQESQGNFTRIWYQERPSADDVTFDSGTFLLTKAKAEQLRAPKVEPTPEPDPIWDLPTPPQPEPNPAPDGGHPGPEVPQKATLRLRGTVPMELWNSIGIRVLPKLKAGEEMNLSVNLSVQIDSDRLQNLEQEVKQALADLNLGEQVSISRDQQ